MSSPKHIHGVYVTRWRLGGIASEDLAHGLVASPASVVRGDVLAVEVVTLGARLGDVAFDRRAVTPVGGVQLGDQLDDLIVGRLDLRGKCHGNCFLCLVGWNSVAQHIPAKGVIRFLGE